MPNFTDPNNQRPDPDHGGIARWRADVVDDLDNADAHTWRECGHRADYASPAEHDRDCPAAGGRS